MTSIEVRSLDGEIALVPDTCPVIIKELRSKLVKPDAIAKFMLDGRFLEDDQLVGGETADKVVLTVIWMSDTFEVVVDRSSSLPLGVGVEDQGGVDLQIKVIRTGLVHKWNHEHPGMKVQRNDQIVAVNGACGNAIKLMDECRKNQVLCMKIRRPQP